MKVKIETSGLTRLVITCGGTGGHFYPGLSIAIEAQRRGCETRLLLSGVNSAAQCEIARRAGVSAVVLPRMPYPGSLSGSLHFLRGFLGGWFKSGAYFSRFHPQALLGMGSFAMTPAVLAARMRRIPVFLHDGNTVFGRANRMCSHLARAAGCAFPPINPSGIHCRRELVGMPVRPELRREAGISKKTAIARLNEYFHVNFSPDLPTLLILGGSQGASSFNTVFPRALKEWDGEVLQVIHLSGRGKLDDARVAYHGFSGPLLLLDSSERMECFLGAADLVFSRSGGSTLAELTLFGKPAVLIPYPYAAEDHQRRNAEWFVSLGAGEMLNNDHLVPASVLKLLSRPVDSWKDQAAASLRAAQPEAAEKMLALIEKNLHR